MADHHIPTFARASIFTPGARNLALLVATTALLSAVGAGWAGPPFVTDDPEPVEKGHGEFYIASQDAWSRTGWSGTLPHFEFNYGPIENVQLHAITPLAFARPDDGAFTYGYGDTELGVKYRFLQEDGLFKGCPMAGVFPLVELPSGSAGRGLGNGGTQIFLPLWLQKSWGREDRQWTTYGGGGYWFNKGPGNHDYCFLGWVLQKQVADHLALGAEINTTSTGTDNGEQSAAFNLGGVYDFSEHYHLLLSAGRNLKGPNLVTIYLAFQITF